MLFKKTIGYASIGILVVGGLIFFWIGLLINGLDPFGIYHLTTTAN